MFLVFLVVSKYNPVRGEKVYLIYWLREVLKPKKYSRWREEKATHIEEPDAGGDEK